MESARTTPAAPASPGVLLVAIVLAGGRSSRLGGRPKAALHFEGQTLLERTLDAVVDARRVVIVGEASLVARAAPCVATAAEATSAARVLVPVPADLAPAGRVLVTREQPPFAGPAAAVAAGVDALVAAQVPPSAMALVLACDMPHLAQAVQTLLDAAARLDAKSGHHTSPEGDAVPDGAAASDRHAEPDGVMAVDDDGRAQFLTAVYRFGALVEAVAVARAAGPLDNLSAKRLFAPLAVTQVRVPPGSTRDVDTVIDAESFGIEVLAPTAVVPTVTVPTAPTATVPTVTVPTATDFDTTGSRP